jgi:hypothetical protein
MKIPDIQERLNQVADELETGADICEAAAEIRRLSANLSRRKPIRKAPISSSPMTPELTEEIRDYWRANPAMSQTDIGAKFNVNAGRVSEAVRGYRR